MEFEDRRNNYDSAYDYQKDQQRRKETYIKVVKTKPKEKAAIVMESQGDRGKREQEEQLAHLRDRMQDAKKNVVWRKKLEAKKPAKKPDILTVNFADRYPAGCVVDPDAYQGGPFKLTKPKSKAVPTKLHDKTRVIERQGYPTMMEAKVTCSELMKECNRLDAEIVEWERKVKTTEHMASVYADHARELAFDPTVQAVVSRGDVVPMAAIAQRKKSSLSVEDLLICSAALRFHHEKGHLVLPWPPEDVGRLEKLCGGKPTVDRLSEFLNMRSLAPDELRLHFRHLKPLLEAEIIQLTEQVTVKERDSARWIKDVRAVELVETSPMQSLPDAFLKELPSEFIEETSSYENSSIAQLSEGLSRVKQKIMEETEKMMERRQVAESEGEEVSCDVNMLMDQVEFCDMDNASLQAMLEDEQKQLKSLRERERYQFEEMEAIKFNIAERERDQNVMKLKRQRFARGIQRKWRERRAIAMKQLAVVLRIQVWWRVRKMRRADKEAKEPSATGFLTTAADAQAGVTVTQSTATYIPSPGEP
eukprot:GEMP01026779.1.p1 GENE.GEMP01026779.1~~GEMP01026779.1.p1  ORF type:complete len:563 (+),score=142.11 GEMP01026779.1:91-1689(+)